MHSIGHSHGNSSLRRSNAWVIACLFMVCTFALPCSILGFRTSHSLAMAQGNEWFDSWALQGKSEREFKKGCESQAELLIDNLKQTVQLTETQENKIRLAAEGDIYRFFLLVAEARHKTKNMRPVNQQVNEISRIISPIQQAVQKGILDKNSLFESTINQVLDDRQQELWQAAKERHSESIYRAILQLQLVQLESRMPLLSKQREKLMELTLARLKGKSVDTQYRFYLIEYGMYSIPADTLNSFLDKTQVEFFQKRGVQALGWKSMLDSAGVKWDDETKTNPAEESKDAAAGKEAPNEEKTDGDGNTDKEQAKPQKKAKTASGNIS